MKSSKLEESLTRSEEMLIEVQNVNSSLLLKVEKVDNDLVLAKQVNDNFS